MKRITLSNETVIEYINLNCKALKCTPDEFILKLINNMLFLSKFKRKKEDDVEV